MDVEEINRRTAHLGHREAAGIVADLSKDWSQFYKEFAISSMARAGRTPRSQSLRLDRRPGRPVRPKHNATRPGKPRLWCGPSERRHGPARMGHR